MVVVSAHGFPVEPISGAHLYDVEVSRGGTRTVTGRGARTDVVLYLREHAFDGNRDRIDEIDVVVRIRGNVSGTSPHVLVIDRVVCSVVIMGSLFPYLLVFRGVGRLSLAMLRLIRSGSSRNVGKASFLLLPMNKTVVSRGVIDDLSSIL